MTNIISYTTHHFVANINKYDRIQTIKQHPDHTIELSKATQNIPLNLSFDDSDIGTYHPFSSVSASYSSNSRQSVIISDAVSAAYNLKNTQEPNLQVWKELFSLVDFIHAKTEDGDFNLNFLETVQIFSGLSYAIEEMEGQIEFTDKLKEEFSAELERYAKLNKWGEFNNLQEYAILRIADIVKNSAPEEARDTTQPPAPLPDDFTLGQLVQVIANAFEDTLITGSFFKAADTSLWKALDIIVTPVAEGSSQDSFYNYLHANAQSIYADIKDQMSIDTENSFKMFGSLKAIIDEARTRYETVTPLSQIFSENGYYSL